ncbi:COG4315 family predicted lipoprotein [Novilysobacter arseniciresistens]|uniref:COG4315 family predicted lipoprotein n=1 Tax=Novilysobacter arseniciresistens TaxID=1385522 RepID=UPI00068FC169|nr:hypothetical protein [Lysobacter arseniciresistens]
MRTIQISTLAAALLALGLAGCDNNVETDTLGSATDDTAMPGSVDDTLPVDEPDVAVDPVNDPGTMADASAIVAPTTLMVASTGAPGPYLTDADGRAIYFLEGDADGSTCTGPCLELWPPVIATETVPEVAADLQADLLGTIERADGTAQLTYNGHPLYYYTRDMGAQAPTGHDLTDDWGEWYLLTPAGTEVDVDVDDEAERG